MVEVVGLDVRDDGDVRVEVEEGAVGLVRLGDEVRARAVAAVRVVALDDAADEEARVEPSSSYQLCLADSPMRSSIVATMDEVVVLPCVPATATVV